MVWVYDEAKGLWVRKVVFTPEAEWEIHGVEEYHLPATYYNVTPTYNCAVLRVAPAGHARPVPGGAGGASDGAEADADADVPGRGPGAAAEDAGRVLRFERARWGFRGGPGMGHNAKQENLKRVPAWRQQWMQHHCVIVADGFYEWDTSAGRKQPYFLQRKDGQPLALAGLYRPPDPATHGMQPGSGGQASRVDDRPEATIVTTQANELVGRLHDRMPVVLEPRDVLAWLSPEAHGERELRDLCRPADDVLRMHAVSTDVNRSTNSWPELLDPVAVPGGTQGRLF